MGGAELSRSSRRATSPCFTQPGNFFPRGPAGSSLGPSVNHLRALSLGTNRTPSSARGGQKGEEVRDASHFDPWELFRYWPPISYEAGGPGPWCAIDTMQENFERAKKHGLLQRRFGMQLQESRVPPGARVDPRKQRRQRSASSWRAQLGRSGSLCCCCKKPQAGS